MADIGVKLVVVVGPTGSGKSRLAMEIAQRAGAEIVSADSQQVYRYMDIGTGKVSVAEREKVAHHLLDVVDPDECMSAARFVDMADTAISAMQEKGIPTVVAGGTGLYVRALLYGLFEGPKADEQFRQQLAAEAAERGTEVLWERLRKVDPESARRIHTTDLIRITRALEIYEFTGMAMSAHHREHSSKTQFPRYQVRVIGLCPPRQQLYALINDRVDNMLKSGLVEEVVRLREMGYSATLRSQSAIGYSEVHQYLAGIINMEESVRLIKRNTRRYARRQLSWYRGDSLVEWHQDSQEVDLGELERYLSGQSGEGTHGK